MSKDFKRALIGPTIGIVGTITVACFSHTAAIILLAISCWSSDVAVRSMQMSKMREAGMLEEMLSDLEKDLPA